MTVPGPPGPRARVGLAEAGELFSTMVPSEAIPAANSLRTRRLWFGSWSSHSPCAQIVRGYSSGTAAWSRLAAWGRGPAANGWSSTRCGGVDLFVGHRRDTQWDAEWNQVEPRWSTRFSR
jgi:hypothetical protein